MLMYLELDLINFDYSHFYHSLTQWKTFRDSMFHFSNNGTYSIHFMFLFSDNEKNSSHFIFFFFFFLFFFSNGKPYNKLIIFFWTYIIFCIHHSSLYRYYLLLPLLCWLRPYTLENNLPLTFMLFSIGY